MMLGGCMSLRFFHHIMVRLVVEDFPRCVLCGTLRMPISGSSYSNERKQTHKTQHVSPFDSSRCSSIPEMWLSIVRWRSIEWY
uniref:Putative secreted protein n=1 Tax=Anopheles darlingi TaxID=43151 RepID=A0A2M4DB27_ANODA